MQDQPVAVPDLEKFGSPYIFFSNNADADLLYVSDSVEEILGFPSNELIGRKYTDFLAGSTLNKDIPELKERRFAGDENHISLRAVKDSEQKTRVLRVQTFGERDNSGKVIANHGMAEDVTAAYQKQQNLRLRLSALEEIAQLLSERELTVLELVMAGRLNKSIARELEITVRGVERIRSRLMSKFSADTSAQLVSLATEWKVLLRVVDILGDQLVAKPPDAAALSMKPRRSMLDRAALSHVRENAR